MTSLHAGLLASARPTALWAGVVLAIGFGGSMPTRADDNPTVNVTVTDKGCEPIALTVTSGKTVFMIKNSSKRRIEWEILKDNMVVEERENIVPGFVQKLTATLDAGDYGMTCGLLSNPQGTLKVTAKEGMKEPPAEPAPAAKPDREG